MDFNGLIDLGSRYLIREFAPEAGRCTSGVRSAGTIGKLIGTTRVRAPGVLVRWQWEGGEVFNGLPSSIVNDIQVNS